MRRASQWFLILAISLGLFLPAAVVSPAEAVSVDIVISQVYGGGGNSGATYTHDFIELYNLGGVAVDVNGCRSVCVFHWKLMAETAWGSDHKYYLGRRRSGGTSSPSSQCTLLVPLP